MDSILVHYSSMSLEILLLLKSCVYGFHKKCIIIPTHKLFHVKECYTLDGKMKNIGIITSGGDCGGLNAVIRGAASTALMRGMRTFTIPNGYAGLYNLVNFDRLVELDEERTDHITSQFAGSDAGHSRVKISKINDPDKYDRIMMGLRKHNIDGSWR